MRAGHNGGRVVKLRGNGTELWQQEDGDVGKVVVLEVVVGVAADQVIPVCCFFGGRVACTACLCASSPTLSPTDPVPRGQLWPTGSVGPGAQGQ